MFLFNNEKYKISSSFERYFRKLEADALLAPSSIAKYKEIAPRIVKMLNDIDVRKLNAETIIDLKHQLNTKK